MDGGHSLGISVEQFDEGILTILPPKSQGTPYPAFVPKTDSDGNDIAGIRVPDVVVPLTTYTDGNHAGTNAKYVKLVTDAADKLVKERFLLEIPGVVQDIETYIGPATSVSTPANP